MSKSAQRFNNIADNFMHSEVHKGSPTIDELKKLLGDVSTKDVCDVACGSGHLGLSLDSLSLTSVDPSEAMLLNVHKLANAKNRKVYTVNAFAEKLPFDDNQFDIVVSRLAAHHFSDIQLAINEMKRIVKKGGQVAIIDLEGYEDQELDQFNHELEVLHDETHVKSYSFKEWSNLITNAGLTIESSFSNLSEKPDGVSVKRWCEIAASGLEAENKIREKLTHAPSAFLKQMNVKKEDDYFLPIRTSLFLASK